MNIIVHFFRKYVYKKEVYRENPISWDMLIKVNIFNIIRRKQMDLDDFKSNIITNVYYIDAQRDVAMHNHLKYDEVFYCIKGDGLGVLEEKEFQLEPGRTFIVPAGIMHTVKTNHEMFLCSFQIPPVED
jgi:quercetin dioxygenase-like cupin family protein